MVRKEGWGWWEEKEVNKRDMKPVARGYYLASLNIQASTQEAQSGRKIEKHGQCGMGTGNIMKC